jgi:hypothetical protein
LNVESTIIANACSFPQHLFRSSRSPTNIPESSHFVQETTTLFSVSSGLVLCFSGAAFLAQLLRKASRSPHSMNGLTSHCARRR